MHPGWTRRTAARNGMSPCRRRARRRLVAVRQAARDREGVVGAGVLSVAARRGRRRASMRKSCRRTWPRLAATLAFRAAARGAACGTYARRRRLPRSRRALPAASSAELAPPAAFLELGRSVESCGSTERRTRRTQSQTVDRTAMVTAEPALRRLVQEEQPQGLPERLHRGPGAVLRRGGLTTVKMAVKSHEISCPGLTSVSCPYDRARPGENQKCVACVRRGWNGRCRVTRASCRADSTEPVG